MSGRIHTGFGFVAAMALFAATASMVAALDSVTPGAVRIDATYEHLGVVWWIVGDDDRDSRFSLEFRKQGASTWLPGASSMRAYPSLEVNGAPLDLNYHAASALFLEPNTNYDLRLTLEDPDGGGEVRIEAGASRPELPVALTGRRRYVIPGNGGGNGTLGNPFQGLQTAADAAAPGDVFEVAPGTYSPFQILSSGTSGRPIAFSGPATSSGSAPGAAVVDGTGTDRGIVTLGEYNQTLSHVVLEGLVLEDGRWGIDAQHTSDIVIRHNTIRDVADGIVNRRGDALERNQTVCDNIIVGRTPWPGAGIPSERGIDLKG